jgi:hypothetical protein
MDTTSLAFDADPALGIDDPLPCKLAPHYNSGGYKAEPLSAGVLDASVAAENEGFHSA